MSVQNPNPSTNIDDYNIPELMTIVGISSLGKSEINSNVDKLMNNTTNKKLLVFLEQVREKLLNKSQPTKIKELIDKETQAWMKNEYFLPMDKQQKDKITDRKNTIEVYHEGEHDAIKKEHVGVSNTYNVPVAQDTLNPTLKNTTERLVILDSRYRQYNPLQDNINTDYVLDLSDHLSNVLSLRLYAYQIPYTWYNIATNYGNNYFWIVDRSTMLEVQVVLPDGNYTQTSYLTAVNTILSNAGFSGPTSKMFSIDSIANRTTISITKYGGVPLTATAEIIFYDPTAQYAYTIPNTDKLSQVNKAYYLDESMGWMIGYREPFYTLGTPIISEAIPSFIGTKYLLLCIDDFNQNHLNNQLVTITEPSRAIRVPPYYSYDIPIDIVSPGQENENQPNPDKIFINYTPYVQIKPTAPRTLTQAQIYTVNQIIKNNSNVTNHRLRAPTTTDVFCPLPIKVPACFGQLIPEFGGSMQDNKRTYFGPTNIERLRIRLLDDKGNTLDLNGADWSITLIAECLYQY